MTTKTNTTTTAARDAGRRQASAIFTRIVREEDQPRVSTVREARELVGGFSNPSKMPCHGWSIPAAKCNVGSKLAVVEGSTCSDCYARKGLYVLPGTETAMTRRYHVLMLALTREESARTFARLFAKALGKASFFRWHDSGDLQSLQHLSVICWIAEMRPDVRFWLPTREYKIVREYLRVNGTFPRNLTVRVSAPMRDAEAPMIADGLINLDESTTYLPTSGVHDKKDALGHACDAYTREGECGDCRECWWGENNHVSYPRH